MAGGALMPRGVDYRIPLADLLDAARRHEAGWSLRSIARLHWRRWGYASDKSALEGLRGALRVIDAPVRDRVDATVLASTMHGRSRRAARLPGHPDHAAFLEHRRAVRANRRDRT
jgi:hypothetical protein